MTEKEKIPSCVQPAPGPILAPEETGSSATAQQPTVEEAPVTTARIGKEAPDFETNAFVNGGFKNIKLSDYRGQWVAICFYPGDFTFV